MVFLAVVVASMTAAAAQGQSTRSTVGQAPARASAPTITFTTTPPAAGHRGSVTFEYTSSDPDAYFYCELRGTGTSQVRDFCNSPQSFYVGEGDFTFTVEAFSDEGTGSASYEFSVSHDQALPGRYRFTPLSSYADRGTPLAGDLNEDGTQDLLIVGNPSLVRLGDTRNRKRGIFRAPSFTLDGRVHGDQLIDMNGDGHLDLVDSKRTQVQLGRGDGTFASPSPSGPFGGLADFDGDGRLDTANAAVLSANSLNDIRVFRGNQDGSFDDGVSIPVSGGPFRACPPELNCRFQGAGAGDIDGDGDPDLVLTRDHDNGASQPIVLLNDAFDHFRLARYGASSVAASDISMPDLNGDGLADVVFNQTNPVTSCLCADTAISRGDGSFQDLGTIPGNGGLSVGDVDRDGWLDAIRTQERPQNEPGVRGNLISYGGSDGFGPLTPEPGSTTEATGTATFGDFNGDGRQDIAFKRTHQAGHTSIEVDLNDPEFVFTRGSTRIPASLSGIRRRGVHVTFDCTLACAVSCNLNISERLRDRAGFDSRTVKTVTLKLNAAKRGSRHLRISTATYRRIRATHVNSPRFVARCSAERRG